MSRPAFWLTGRCLGAVLLAAVGHDARADLQSQPALTAQAEQSTDQLTEVVVKAAEPRYVAPTLRDRIGRIWAPVYINDLGPFRLVLDSGANHSGINAQVAQALGLTPDASQKMLLRGVTGSATVATVRVNSILIGDLALGPSQLPILTDPLGGADGILGTEQMAGRRIRVDFRHDRITITRSHNERADGDFRTIPFQLMRGNLLAVDASLGGVHTMAIIDTGGEATIGNLALRQALERHASRLVTRPDTITGVTTDVQAGDEARAPPLVIPALEPHGAVEIRYTDVTFGDMHIFDHWHLTGQPTMLIGMDALGLLDTLIIDYRRQELQIKMRDGT
ncbi:MAG TPA: retropepsin-like aspartic protease [Steroidobacteraceae bacterium]